MEAVRWKMAERFGWTLEYIDALALEDLHQLLQIDDGIRKAKGIGVKVYGEKSR